MKEIKNNNEHFQRITIEINEDRLSIYQEAAAIINGSINILAKAGHEFTEKNGCTEKLTRVREGYVGIEIGIDDRKVLSKFWHEINVLQKKSNLHKRVSKM